MCCSVYVSPTTAPSCTITDPSDCGSNHNFRYFENSDMTSDKTGYHDDCDSDCDSDCYDSFALDLISEDLTTAAETNMEAGVSLNNGIERASESSE